MAVFRPFRAIRPQPQVAAEVAALPYDTMSSAEARVYVADKPLSFVHIDKAEVDLPPETDLYDAAVYACAASTLQRQIGEGIFRQDDSPCYYIYRQTWQGRTQTGLVGCAAIDDYRDNIIKKHELTHPEKETDRIKHVTACNANTGPIFLTYRDTRGVADILNEQAGAAAPEVEFTQGGVLQQIWPISDAQTIEQLRAAFAATPFLYIADGHHRCASAYRVGSARREAARAAGQQIPPEAESNFFLAVAFPAGQLKIMDYNRVVKDLNGQSRAEFLSRLDAGFDVEAIGGKGQPYIPEAGHFFGMYLDGVWHKCRMRRGTFDPRDPVGALDVSILQENLLAPILGVKDPRRDKRIEFIGGIRGWQELERRCAEDMRIAFLMYPTTVEELMRIADSGNIMPPKSTWFEPKLLSGLFIHDLEQ
ncbi:MAG: DUF1015 family protein [Oscillospiraceae bacterium]|jgi:uncharacterized protein (DUF1015 family)|nr:DUF1015 family protein [Oscillospiraceae bacterium]